MRFMFVPGGICIFMLAALAVACMYEAFRACCITAAAAAAETSELGVNKLFSFCCCCRNNGLLFMCCWFRVCWYGDEFARFTAAMLVIGVEW